MTRPPYPIKATPEPPSPSLSPSPAGLVLEVYRLDPRAKLPLRGTPDSIGFDVHALLLSESGRPISRMVPQKNTIAIPTGLIVRPPPGYYIQVASRSGLAMNSLFVANAPGIIDPDYSGELRILLFNGGYETQYVQHEWRIAQLILAPISKAEISETQTRPSNDGRGTAGFGSTGL